VQIARLAVAACALLVLVGCGIGYSSQNPPSSSASPTAAAERSEYRASDGARKVLGNGIVLTVSSPKSFTPTDTAFPRAPRAVAFELTVDNNSTVAYRPASLSFTAAADGEPTEQVIDSTQGYNGPSGATEEVAPNDSLRIMVAFATSEARSRLRVTVRADATSSAPVLLFDGVV
jgi:hypothetical protein